MLHQFSIRLKLIAVIAFLLTALAVTGAVAFAQMRAINSAAHEIQSAWLPSVRWLGEMRVQAARYRAVLRDYLIVAESARADVDKNLAARKADYEKARAKYEPLISSANERELAAEVEKLWQVFVKSAEDVQTLARKGDLEAAKATNAGKVVPAGRAMDAVMSKMTELNDNGAEASAKNANDTYAAASRMMVAIFAVAMLLGLAAAIYLVRDIARGIASVLTPIDALAAGDLDAAIPALSPHTEMGKIAAAIAVFKQALVDKKRADDDAKHEASLKSARAEHISKATGEFESAIGELISTFTGASVELEASAGTLTKTSDMTIRMSGSAKDAAQSMSDNVQSVAAAAEEITSSVHEIGRQVQEMQPHRRERGRTGRPRRPEHRAPGEVRRADRQRCQADHRSGRADQPARAQRHHRGCARRRSRPRLCSGRLRSEELSPTRLRRRPTRSPRRSPTCRRRPPRRSPRSTRYLRPSS